MSKMKLRISLSQQEGNIFNQFLAALNQPAYEAWVAQADKPNRIPLRGIPGMLSHEEVARRLVMGYIMKQIESVNGTPVTSPNGDQSTGVEDAISQQVVTSSTGATHGIPEQEIIPSDSRAEQSGGISPTPGVEDAQASPRQTSIE